MSLKETEVCDLFASNLLTNYEHINPFPIQKKNYSARRTTTSTSPYLYYSLAINNISQMTLKTNIFHQREKCIKRSATRKRRQNENIEILILHRNAFACQNNICVCVCVSASLNNAA